MSTNSITLRRGLPALRRGRGHAASHCRFQRAMCGALLVFTTCIFTASSATADPSDPLRAGVVGARAGSCAPLRPDPLIDQVAREVNESTDKWVDHTGRTPPVADALPLLKDLGYGGSKAAILSSAGTTVNAVKALLLEGYAKIPDCSYTDYGVSVLQNASKKITLMTVVLAA